MHRRPAIAVLDVGFNLHPDLPARRVIACRDTTGSRVVPFRYGDPKTVAEHGTRTMLLSAGDGRSSGIPSFAPNARVVLLKVGQSGRVPRESLVRAFHWLLRKGPTLGIRVVVCPLGDDPEEPGTRSPVRDLVKELDAHGLIVVAAAGWDPAGACVSPASSPYAIGVGGWDIEDDVPSMGPRPGLVEGVLKPDLLAPAVPLDVPAADGSRTPERAGGTSFAAAIVAGVAVRLLQDDPTLSRTDVLDRLVGHARVVPGQPPYLDPARLRRLRRQ